MHIANACKFLIFENTGVIVMRKVFFLPIIVTQLMSDTATANIFSGSQNWAGMQIEVKPPS